MKEKGANSALRFARRIDNVRLTGILGSTIEEVDPNGFTVSREAILVDVSDIVNGNPGMHRTRLRANSLVDIDLLVTIAAMQRSSTFKALHHNGAFSHFTNVGIDKKFPIPVNPKERRKILGIIHGDGYKGVVSQRSA